MLKDTVKPAINTWNRMMIVNQANLSLIKTQMICMVEQESFIFLTVDLSG